MSGGLNPVGAGRLPHDGAAVGADSDLDILFSERKDGKIQQMIYQEQLHYKSQLCPGRAGDFL